MKNITEKEIKTIIKSTVKKLLNIEMIKLRAFLIPYISQEEQEEIEKIFHKPERRSEKEQIVKI